MKKLIITLYAFITLTGATLYAESIKVTDENEDIVGRYVYEGTTQEGYRYGTFTAEYLRIAPYQVIENSYNQGTPVWLAVSGATNTLVGYIHNPHYKKVKHGIAGAPSKKIMLFRYEIPMNDVIIQSGYKTQTLTPQQRGRLQQIGSLIDNLNDLKYNYGQDSELLNNELEALIAEEEAIIRSAN